MHFYVVAVVGAVAVVAAEVVAAVVMVSLGMKGGSHNLCNNCAFRLLYIGALLRHALDEAFNSVTAMRWRRKLKWITS